MISSANHNGLKWKKACFECLRTFETLKTEINPRQKTYSHFIIQRAKLKTLLESKDFYFCINIWFNCYEYYLKVKIEKLSIYKL